MREHAAQLVQGEEAQNAFGHRDGGVLGAAAGREGVRGLPRDEVHSRHRHVRAHGQLAHDAEEVGGILLGQLTGPVGREDDPVGEPVAAEVHHDREHEEDGEALRAAEELADPHQEPGQQAEQKRRLQGVRHGYAFIRRGRRRFI